MSLSTEEACIPMMTTGGGAEDKGRESDEESDPDYKVDEVKTDDKANADRSTGRARSIIAKIKDQLTVKSPSLIKFKKILKIILLLLPEPLLMLMMVSIAMSISALATASRSSKTCWSFVICYSASTVVVATCVASVYMYVTGKLPVRALVSLLMSPVGVWASVVVDTALMRADAKDVRDSQGKHDAVMRKLIFLHGVVGVTLAIVIQCIPSVCPLVPGDGK